MRIVYLLDNEKYFAWKSDWRDIDWVFKLYGDRFWVACRLYWAFVRKGISQGRRKNLTGGGFIRVQWAGLPSNQYEWQRCLKGQMNTYWG